MLCVPNLYRTLACNVELESDRTVPCTNNRVVVRELRRKWLAVFEDFEDSRASDQPSVVRDRLQTRHFVDVRHVQRLQARVVADVPDLEHAVCVASDEARQVLRNVDADERVFVSFELDNVVFVVRVPHEHIEVEASADEYLVFF